MSPPPTKAPPTPYRQIRAHYDAEAYSAPIALAAVETQSLNGSPDLSINRMTWIKPTFCWMMYRSAYGTKDERQTHILALKMTHERFRKLLEQAVACNGRGKLSAEERGRGVRVQWDPERGPGLEGRKYRSLQVGISRSVVEWWVKEGIESIEDVTEMAERLRAEMVRHKEEKRGERKKSIEELVRMGRLA